MRSRGNRTAGGVSGGGSSVPAAAIAAAELGEVAAVRARARKGNGALL
jgi:hypothetical protein